MRAITVSSGTAQVRREPDEAVIVLGRSAACDVVLPDLMVSSRHARVLWNGSAWVLEDTGSVNGTYVGGRQVDRVVVDGTVEVRLGDPEYGPVVRLAAVAAAAAPRPALPTPLSTPTPTPTPTPLAPPTPAFGAPLPVVNQASPAAAPAPARSVLPAPAFASPVAAAAAGATALGGEVFGVYDLTVQTAGVTRLDRLTFTLRKGEMLAVLGGSGAGKSTMLKAITGSDPANSGLVWFEGRDLYRDFEQVRQRIGYVPQDDILHSALTVRATLDFGSMLRMPDATAAERATRVREVVDELGLTHRFEAKVTELSGGQRKRLNVALELLSRPPLLILDEPTSGLDPANERSLMQLLRQLADDGRTVIVVTHATESLFLCDRVLFLARGGTPAFLGPPAELAGTFNAPSLVDAFGFVDNHPDPTELRRRFDATHRPPARPAVLPSPAPPAALPWQRRWARDADQVGHDFWILLRRAVAILRGDKRNATIMLAQGPVIAVLMLAVFGSGKLKSGGLPEASSSSVLLALVLSVVFVGAAGSVREIVKERPILLREQAVGVSTVGYLASKMVLLGSLVTVQAFLIVLFTLLRQDGREGGFFWFGSATEVAAAVVLSGLTAVGLGLLISAAVTSADKAMTLLPVALFLQLLLAGVIVPVNTVGVQQLSWLTGSQWGLDAVGSVHGLWDLRGCGTPGPNGKTPTCNGLWQHDGVNWVISMVMLTVMLLGTLYLAFRLLRRQDPVVVLGGKAASA